MKTLAIIILLVLALQGCQKTEIINHYSKYSLTLVAETDLDTFYYTDPFDGVERMSPYGHAFVYGAKQAGDVLSLKGYTNDFSKSTIVFHVIHNEDTLDTEVLECPGKQKVVFDYKFVLK